MTLNTNSGESPPQLWTDAGFESTAVNSELRSFSASTSFFDPPPAQTTPPQPDDILLGPEIVSAVERVVQVGILPLLVLWGVSTNVINMAAFLHQGLGDRVNLCLFSLAVADTGYLLTLFVGRIYSIAELVDADMGLYWRLVNMNMYGVYTGFLNVANVLTMVIAIDRCACVLNPLHVRRAIRTRWVAGGIVVLYILILILCSLECFRFTIVSTFDPATNTTRYKSERTQFYYQHRTFLDVINNYVFNVITPTVSLVVVAAATTLTGLRLRTAQAWRQRVSLDLRQPPLAGVSATDRREASVTRMLVVICVFYTVCTSPWVAMTITSKVVTGFSPRERYWDLFYVTNTLMHLLASINASVNFLVYVTRGTRFRATVRSLFTRCKPRSQQKGGPGPQTTIPTVTTLSCQ